MIADFAAIGQPFWRFAKEKRVRLQKSFARMACAKSIIVAQRLQRKARFTLQKCNVNATQNLRCRKWHVVI